MKLASYSWVMAALAAASAFSATAPPSAGVWNIATSGKAASSGDLEFRVTSVDGSDPVEISVPVIAGANEESMARTIRRVMSSQLPRGRYNVELGEGGNVMVSDTRGRPTFTLELLNSDIDNVRVAVQSVTPAAAPTVPQQAVPADPPPNGRPVQTVPGNALPPASSTPAPIGTPPTGGTIPVPDPVRVPGPSTTVPSPSQNVPPPPAVPTPAPAAPPGNAPPVPEDGSTPGTVPGSSPPMSPPLNRGAAGAPASAPPPGSPRGS
jgi:hypothetical protein